jgi:hypothetical protein
VFTADGIAILNQRAGQHDGLDVKPWRTMRR